MTEVRYKINDKELDMEISGHAGFAEIGSDIVCSAISILCQTLLSQIASMTTDFKFEISDGYMWVNTKDNNARVAYETILKGYELIKESYPQYVSIIQE